MTGFGIFILTETIMKIQSNILPEPPTMGIVGTLAFMVNLGVALMLYKFRSGDSNVQSVRLCTRNDVIGNLMVITAAGFVHYTQTGWADWVAGFILACLGLMSGLPVIKLARGELKSAPQNHIAVTEK